jgi:mono/diheme cytochrome c family protein
MKNFFVSLMILVLSVPTIVLADAGLDFKGKCAACHGANANLQPKTARLMKVDPKKLALLASGLTRDEMIAVTEKGRNKMPAFEKELTRQQTEAIIDYVMSLKKKK